MRVVNTYSRWERGIRVDTSKFLKIYTLPKSQGKETDVYSNSI